MTALRQAAASLRVEIESTLPPNAFLRIDRTGTALYAVGGDASAAAAAGWLCEARGRITLVAPGLPQLAALRGCTPSDPLTAAFAARPDDPAVLPVFAACLRALEMPPTPSAHAKLDKQLRQAMAAALRTRTGGGLETCRALFLLINPTS